MICIKNMPCKDCMYFNGFKQPDKTEKREYVRCDKAKDGHANSLIVISDRKLKCNEYKMEED